MHFSVWMERMSGHKTKPLSPLFKAQCFKPEGDEPQTAQVTFRLDQRLKDAIVEHVDNPSEWMRMVLAQAAKEQGWLRDLD